MAGFANKFRSVEEYAKPLWSDTLEFSIKCFLDWGYLNIGGFRNVRRGTIAAYGNDESRLRRVTERGQPKVSVFEGVRSDWVWEKNLDYHTQPIHPSGVWVNSNFLPVGTSGLYIDFPRGRICMDLPVRDSDVIQCEHSYRFVQTSTSDARWFRQIQFDSFRGDSANFQKSGSGEYHILAQNRVQLPHIIVEAIPQSSRHGYELGTHVQTVYQEVILNCFTETGYDRKQTHDVLMSQQDWRIASLDKQRMIMENAFPLNAYGMATSGALTYPQLTLPSGEGGYLKYKFWIKKTDSMPYEHLNGAYWSAVKWTTETELP